jgi:hypothetical protein
MVRDEPARRFLWLRRSEVRSEQRSLIVLATGASKARRLAARDNDDGRLFCEWLG